MEPLIHQILYHSKVTVDDVAEWLESCCLGDWAIEVTENSTRQDGISLIIEFAKKSDKTSFLECCD